MKPKVEIKVNDEVWYYDASIGPREAKVMSYDVTANSCKLTFKSKTMDYMNGRSVSYFHVFKRPEQWQELVEEMRDDARHLELEARKIIEREYEETT